jgi:hypothetical protein
MDPSNYQLNRKRPERDLLVFIVCSCSHEQARQLPRCSCHAADATAADWSCKDLQTLEHDFHLESTLDARVPVRKLGRVAALTKGLHHGFNLVRTAATPVTQFLGDRELLEHDTDTRGHNKACAQAMHAVGACVL